MTKLFGTDGIRGIANSRFMNTDVAVAVGRAAGYFVLKDGELPQIVIGKDTRLSCYMLEEALASGITSMGINVVKTGPLPTPGVAFICRSMRSRLGIMISASHNPADENGIKIFSHEGFKLTEEEENEIERLVVLAGEDTVIGDELLSTRINESSQEVIAAANNKDRKDFVTKYTGKLKWTIIGNFFYITYIIFNKDEFVMKWMELVEYPNEEFKRSFLGILIADLAFCYIVEKICKHVYIRSF